MSFDALSKYPSYETRQRNLSEYLWSLFKNLRLKICFWRMPKEPKMGNFYESSHGFWKTVATRLKEMNSVYNANNEPVWKVFPNFSNERNAR